MASKLSSHIGLLERAEEKRIKNLIRTAKLPIIWPKWDEKKYFQLMSNDKKIKNKVIHYVVLDCIGKAKLLPIEKEAVSQALFGAKN